MGDIKSQLADLASQVSRAMANLHLSDQENKLVKLREQMSAPDFWRDQEMVKKISSQAALLEKQIKSWRDLEQRLTDLSVLVQAEVSAELVGELTEEMDKLKNIFADLSRQSYFHGPYDSHPALLTINSGAGGVDAQDWAAMLERMYLRFCETMGWSLKYLSRAAGAEAGLKSSTFEVQGADAYGYLKNEAGVHRLVRLSPYDADHARHTSFAMVEVLPEMSEADITIKEDDLKIDTFRSSGHGGQSVNTTDSAVRITHLPTGIAVMCQNERSQLQNKRQALVYLRSRVKKYYEAEKEEERKMLKGEYTAAAWGNQIRSYVLHPYQMVKDHRSNLETNQTASVLDGDLLPFIQANLERLAKA